MYGKSPAVQEMCLLGFHISLRLIALLALAACYLRSLAASAVR